MKIFDTKDVSTGSERIFLSILTRAVDDSGWLEQIPYKPPIIVEIRI